MEKIKIFSREAQEIYNRFKTQNGSEHIGKPVTIEILSDICRAIKPKRVLELGGGLGTNSYTILKNSEAYLDIYEHNEFCRDKLTDNLTEYKQRYSVIKDYKILPPAEDYDLVVVDGGSGKSEYDGGFFKAIYVYLVYLNSVKVIYIDGHRRFQGMLARKALKNDYVYKLTKYQDIEYNGEILNGGSKIECWKSSSKLLKLFNYLYWEVKEWYPIKYFISYRLSRIKKLLK